MTEGAHCNNHDLHLHVGTVLQVHVHVCAEHEEGSEVRIRTCVSVG